MILKFIVPGEPKGKSRPIVTKSGRAFTPQKTVNYENWVKLCYSELNPERMLEGAIKATIIGYFPIPSSTSKKNKEKMLNGEIMHTKKVDSDNLAKIILDSLNGIAYKDDSAVCILIVNKFYSDIPRVEITLEEI